MKVNEVENFMEILAPKKLALSYDNVGLLIGDSNSDITGILIALDVNKNVIEEAVKNNINLIITHHPLIFGGINKITNNTSTGRHIINLIENKISLFSAHTNFDACNGGTNDQLFNLLELTNKENFSEEFLGKAGTLKNEMTLKDFLVDFKEKLKIDVIRVVGNENKIIKKIGLCTGAGNDINLFDQALKLNCQVFITGDLTFHKMQYALENDLILIDGTHYQTEVIGLTFLKESLKIKFPNTNIVISKVNGQVFKNF